MDEDSWLVGRESRWRMGEVGTVAASANADEIGGRRQSRESELGKRSTRPQWMDGRRVAGNKRALERATRWVSFLLEAVSRTFPFSDKVGD